MVKEIEYAVILEPDEGLAGSFNAGRVHYLS